MIMLESSNKQWTSSFNEAMTLSYGYPRRIWKQAFCQQTQARCYTLVYIIKLFF